MALWHDGLVWGVDIGVWWQILEYIFWGLLLWIGSCLGFDVTVEWHSAFALELALTEFGTDCMVICLEQHCMLLYIIHPSNSS